MKSAWTAAVAVLTVLFLGALWLFPIVAFSHPGINEAIYLSELGPLILLLVVLASVLSLILASFRKLSSDLPLSLGALMLAVGLFAALGMAAFGDMQDDRFMALLFVSPPAVVAGALIVGGAWAIRRRAPGRAGAALTKALAAGFVIGAWLLARGPRDWTWAPYGLDWFMVIALAAIVLSVLEARNPEAQPDARPENHRFPARRA